MEELFFSAAELSEVLDITVKEACPSWEVVSAWKEFFL